jgi:SAM-dependent methyltransferase
VTPEQFELFARIEQEHWWFVARRQIASALLERIAPAAPDTLLIDVGCGTGGNVAAFAERFRCLGFDQSEQAIGYARERFPNVEFARMGELTEIEPSLARAGVVTCMDVIEHVADDTGFVARLVGATLPGTQLLLTVPAGMELWSEHDVTNGHERRYTVDGFAALWATLPVRVRLLSAFNARLYPVVRATRALSRARGRAYGAAGTDFAMPPRVVNEALRRIFAGELRALRDAVDTPERPYARGVSVIALLEHTA